MKVIRIGGIASLFLALIVLLFLFFFIIPAVIIIALILLTIGLLVAIPSFLISKIRNKKESNPKDDTIDVKYRIKKG